MLFIVLVIANIISIANIALIAPFFPPLAEEAGISPEMVGLVLSMNPIGAFVASLYLGKSEKNVY